MHSSLILTLLSFSLTVWADDEELGGSSVAGAAVSCYKELEVCLASCELSCYVVDHCNDSPGEMVACAPNTVQMIIITLIFVVLVLSCCCTICFCSPCCLCAILLKKRRERQRREAATQAQNVSLLSKA